MAERTIEIHNATGQPLVVGFADFKKPNRILAFFGFEPKERNLVGYASYCYPIDQRSLAVSLAPAKTSQVMIFNDVPCASMFRKSKEHVLNRKLATPGAIVAIWSHGNQPRCNHVPKSPVMPHPSMSKIPSIQSIVLF